MKKFQLVAAICFGIMASRGLHGQVRYDVTFTNAVHHEVEITVTYPNVPAGVLELRLSRSSPGRYALHEFGKNVYRFRADDGMGRALPVSRPDPYQWNVTTLGGTVRVVYTLFADRAGGTYSQIDNSHAHMNMPATFMWARGYEHHPIDITFHPPVGASWRAATQLFPGSSPMNFTAPDLQYFLDSPTELSDHAWREWSVTSGGRTYSIRLAVHHLGTDAEVDAYTAWVKAVVEQQIAVFGETPDYDSGTYTFIADYLPWASGDGMEHRNSTILTSTGSLATNALGLLGTVSHEFFHSWNVERLRPATLEPFNFEEANMSRELWFAEGFTSYYTSLFIKRAGIIDTEEFGRRLAGGLSTVINSPGRQYFSAVEMSMQAPFVDAATAIDPDNFSNTFISYYTWGSAIGLNLDLTLRSRFGSSLDAFYRTLWDQFGRPEIPYHVEDLEKALGEFVNDPTFASTFFQRFIKVSDVPDYASLLAHAGFVFQKARPGVAWFGPAQLQDVENGVRLGSGTIVGTPLYEAGLERLDVITKIDGRSVRTPSDVREAIAARSPGDQITIEYEQRSEMKTGTLRLAEDPAFEVITFEAAGRPVTNEIARFRESWLGKK